MEFSRYVLALEFLSESILATGGEFEGIKILDIEKETCLQTLKGHATRVKDLCTTDDLLKEDCRRLLLFSVSSDGDLRGWAFNPENFEEEAKIVAKYEVPGRPTCLTVIGRKTFPRKLETPAEAEKMAVKTEQESKTKNKKQKGKGKVDRRIAKTSGDEPKKKKLKAKKKKSAKKRIGSCQKEVEEGADGANAKSETETEEMEVNESGGIVEEENEESGDE